MLSLFWFGDFWELDGMRPRILGMLDLFVIEGVGVFLLLLYVWLSHVGDDLDLSFLVLVFAILVLDLIALVLVSVSV